MNNIAYFILTIAAAVVFNTALLKPEKEVEINGVRMEYHCVSFAENLVKAKVAYADSTHEYLGTSKVFWIRNARQESQKPCFFFRFRVVIFSPFN